MLEERRPIQSLTAVPVAGHPDGHPLVIPRVIPAQYWIVTGGGAKLSWVTGTHAMVNRHRLMPRIKRSQLLGYS